jgi:hypothetical protein
MYLFCPRCNSQHLASSRCPRCSSRLLSPSEVPEVLAARTPPPPPPVQPGFAGRIVVGTLVALGLHLALREWVFAAVGAVGAATTGGELWLGYALRVIGAALGGLLAGAGRPRSLATGTLVGAACGVAWLAVDAYPEVTFDVTRLVAAGILLAVGGAAAVVGGWVWPPPVEVKPPESSRNSSLFRLKPTDGRKTGRPIGWVRIVIGVTVAVCGVLAADLVRQGLGRLPQGLFNNLTMTARSDALIAGFLCVLAGVLAGACTGTGWRQGLITGFLAAIGVATVSATFPDGPPLAVQYVIDVLGLGDMPQQGLAAAAGVVCGVVTVAGWFGGQLFPVLRKKKRLGD